MSKSIALGLLCASADSTCHTAGQVHRFAKPHDRANSHSHHGLDTHAGANACHSDLTPWRIPDALRL